MINSLPSEGTSFMMTIKKAETITGYRIFTRRHPHTKRTMAAAETEAGQIIWAALGKDDQEAICQLVEDVYQMNSHIVMERQGWRCKECGGLRPLSAHHVKKRSHGRYDGIDNLEGLCADCHERRHGSRATKQKITRR